jgi:hypothetical protein
MTSRGGWHLEHTPEQGHGGVDRVAGVVEDRRDTCLVVEDAHSVRYSR